MKAQQVAALDDARSANSTSVNRATATCEPGVATTDLDIGGVRARLYNNGGLFWRQNDPVYEVPKGSGQLAIFAAGLWMGAEVAGEVRFAGADYGFWEYWPGPLDDNGDAPADCTPFDRYWTVRVQSDGSLAGDVEDWPVDLGASFEDANGDGEYNVADGDLPTLFGDQTTFWVMNDKGGPHNWSDTQALGVEVRVTAFAFDSEDEAFGLATFYRYEIVNKSSDTFDGLRIGFWKDADVGDFNDDYVGSDPSRGLAFTYNGDNLDECCYGTRPPALGVDLLSGAEGFMYYTNDATTTGNPANGRDAYDFLGFTWKDEVPVTVGGIGYNPGSSEPPTTWFFPGAPETAEFWSERNLTEEGEASVPGDRRGIAVANPLTLGPGESTAVDVAILFARAANNLQSVSVLREHSDQVQAAYDAGSLFPPVVVADEADELAQVPDLLRVEAYPNPTRDQATLRLDLPESGPLRVVVYDLLGREVQQVAQGRRAAGTYRMALDTSTLPTGLYVVTAETTEARVAQRLFVVR
ncbi:MAG: T9SS type A sorting domain-containing protein [Bacteroidota bacterium]